MLGEAVVAIDDDPPAAVGKQPLGERSKRSCPGTVDQTVRSSCHSSSLSVTVEAGVGSALSLLVSHTVSKNTPCR